MKLREASGVFLIERSRFKLKDNLNSFESLLEFLYSLIWTPLSVPL